MGFQPPLLHCIAGCPPLWAQASGQKPCLLFAGAPFEQDPQFRQLRNTLLDVFRGQVVPSYNLVGLDSLRWREDMFNRAMMAVALLKILKATNYFPQKSDADSFTSDEVRFVLLLLHCIMFYS